MSIDLILKGKLEFLDNANRESYLKRNDICNQVRENLEKSDSIFVLKTSNALNLYKIEDLMKLINPALYNSKMCSIISAVFILVMSILLISYYGSVSFSKYRVLNEMIVLMYFLHISIISFISFFGFVKTKMYLKVKNLKKYIVESDSRYIQIAPKKQFLQILKSA